MSSERRALRQPKPALGAFVRVAICVAAFAMVAWAAFLSPRQPRPAIDANGNPVVWSAAR